MKVGRNEPCPCGSGRKVKRCCGVEGVRRSREATADLLGLALHFPRYRPESPAFDAWVQTLDGELTRELVEEGIAILGESEQERLATGFGEQYPDVWATIVAEAGGEHEASLTVLVGAVVAGVGERTAPLDPDGLAWLEEDEQVRDDPVTSLAAVLEPFDLWSAIEVTVAFDEFHAGASYGAVAARLATEWHERRLLVLLERLSQRLPLPDYPLASAALADASRLVAARPRVQRRLRAALLLDSFPTALDALRLAA